MLAFSRQQRQCPVSFLHDLLPILHLKLYQCPYLVHRHKYAVENFTKQSIELANACLVFKSYQSFSDWLNSLGLSNIVFRNRQSFWNFDRTKLYIHSESIFLLVVLDYASLLKSCSYFYPLLKVPASTASCLQ